MNRSGFCKIFVSTLICCAAVLSCGSKNSPQSDSGAIKNSPDQKSITIKSGVLTIGTEFGYPPFEYLADDGKTLIGFDVDMWNELCRRLNLEPKFYDTQWAGLFSALESGRYDCVISAVTITPERQEKFLITKPYIQNSQCFIVNRNSGLTLESPEKLEGLKVAYQAETVSDVFVANLKDGGMNLLTYEYDKLMDAFDDLRFGRVDVVVAESVASKIIVKTKPDIFRVDYVGQADAFFGLLVNKKNPELFEKIQATLDDMYADGWMAVNEEKWLN